jgi:hypothetical protein
MKDGFKIIRLKGENAYQAVAKRIEASGAKWPGRGRIWAVEILMTFSDHADPMPSSEVLEERVTAFLDQEFGPDNVVAIWLHREERTPHVQALAVPICWAMSPGRPRDDEVEPKKELVVSWNHFSGADEVDYRDPKKVKKPKNPRRKKVEKLKTHKNRVMSGWQDRYAQIWKDYGIKRGIPSATKHIPLKRIRGDLKAIAAMSEAAHKGVFSSISEIHLEPADLSKLQKNPTEATLSELYQKYVLPKVESHLDVLKVQAAKSIQLDSALKARDKLWEAHVALQKQHEALLAATSGGHPSYAQLKAENGLLKGQMDELKAASANPNPEALLEHLGRLSDEEFALLIETGREERREASAKRKMRKISEPGKGFQEPSGPSQ